MFRKGLVAGIIVLFIGIIVQPAFANEITNVRPSENIDDCNCQVDDYYDIVRVKSLLNRADRLLNRVEIFTNLIFLMSKDNPEVTEDCEELSKKITTLKEINKELDTNPPKREYPIICRIIEPIYDILNSLENWVNSMAEKLEDYPKLRNIFLDLTLFTITLPYFIFYAFALLFNCVEPPFPPPLL